jgi:NADH-quinone oxidoreductase subunit G
MAKIIVDEREYEVRDGQNLLQAALSVGLDIPYFCWHPALGSVGACRQCAVRQFRDANDTRGKLVMACMTPAVEGARISIDDQEARDFRSSIIEYLMINHPHDCPVCDEGGECHLQDMTVLTGHNYRRYDGKKRTFRNQDLGPLVNHEMNRCIQCYRCVRFYRDYAGGRDFDVFGLRSRVYYGREFDGVLESEFSGNLVEVCPTGVFTDKTLKEHYTRKWDLQTAPSVCVHCGVGCNTIAGERYGTLRRIYNRYNSEVNGYFLCDRGRYGYEFVNDSRRLRSAMAREKRDSEATPVESGEALRAAASALKEGKRLIGIGSPRASLEANFALRTLVGSDNFYAGVSALEHQLSRLTLDIMGSGSARSPSLADVARSDAALVLGEDVTQTAPMLALALRQSQRRAPLREAAKLRVPEWDAAGVRNATQEARGPLYVAATQGTRLDEVATRSYQASPEELARLGFAVAHAIDDASPAVRDLPADVAALAAEIAASLVSAESPVVVSGGGCSSEDVLRAAANVARALRCKGRPAQLCLTAPECDSLGLALLGGGTLADALAGAAPDVIIVLENDLYRRADAASVDAFLNAAQRVIVVDHTTNATTARADILLPAATFAESDGTLLNNEGRAQRSYQVFPPPGDVSESWRWLRDLALEAGRREFEGWTNIDAAGSALATTLPVFGSITEIAPPAEFRIVGRPIARQSGRYSGRTAMNANVDVSESPPPEDGDSPFVFSMEGYQGQPPSPLIPRFWAPGWNSVQAVNKFQEEIGGPLRGGDTGRRLIEPPESAEASYYVDVPEASAPPTGHYRLVAAHHIFGSEELSALAPGIAKLATQPYAGLSPEDAEETSLEPGQEVELSLEGRSYRLPVRVVDGLPKGVVALPAGLTGMGWLKLPAWGELKNPRSERGPTL